MTRTQTKRSGPPARQQQGGPPARQQSGPPAVRAGQQLSQAEHAELQWERWLTEQITQVIGAMPMSVAEGDLKRARAQLRVAFTRATSASEKLWQCTPESIASCVVMSAMTGLFPGGPRPDVDIIPRKNKHNGNRLELNWQISYRGYIRLARRTPGWNIKPTVVFEGDQFDVVGGTSPAIHHRPKLDRGDVLKDAKVAWDMIRFVYVVVTDPMGRTFFDHLDKGQIAARRACAQNMAFWGPWPIEMTLKTACRFAGQREMFPTDDPTRYAMHLEMEAGEKGRTVVAASAPAPQLPGAPPALPAGGVDQVAAVLDATGQPAAAPVAPDPPAQPSAPVRLDAEQLAKLKAMCDEEPAISYQGVEEAMGGPLAEVQSEPGEDQGALHTRILEVIRDHKKRAAKKK